MAKSVLRWNLKAELRKIKDWLAVRDVERDLRKLRESLDHRADKPAPATFYLSDLGLSEYYRGAVAVLEGDVSGWVNLHAGWRYEALRVRVHVGRFDDSLRKLGGVYDDDKIGVGTYAHGEINGAMLNLATAIAFGEDKFADWCGPRMVRNLVEQDPLVLERSWLFACPFEPFMAKLYALWRGIDLDLRKCAIGDMTPYDRALDAWADEVAFAAAFLEICEFHGSHVRKEDDPFHWPPYTVFPGEILALVRVRRELGLSVPLVEHPLLSTPLAVVPDPVPRREHDELLEEVVSACVRAYPWFEIPW